MLSDRDNVSLAGLSPPPAQLISMALLMIHLQKRSQECARFQTRDARFLFLLILVQQ